MAVARRGRNKFRLFSKKNRSSAYKPSNSYSLSSSYGSNSYSSSYNSVGTYSNDYVLPNPLVPERTPCITKEQWDEIDTNNTVLDNLNAVNWDPAAY